jgi:hypothetical protein
MCLVKNVVVAVVVVEGEEEKRGFITQNFSSNNSFPSNQTRGDLVDANIYLDEEKK